MLTASPCINPFLSFPITLNLISNIEQTGELYRLSHRLVVQGSPDSGELHLALHRSLEWRAYRTGYLRLLPP